MKKIDILMATYNGEKYLKEQIESILNQTYKNFRLIISDDCSKDKTTELLKEYAKRDDRIIVYFQEKNLGVVKNFEVLLSKVENEYFMFSDQDDCWYENKIELSLKKMQETNSDLIYTDLEVVDENLKIINPSYWKLKGLDRKVKKYNNFSSIYLNNFVTGCTMLVKSEWIKKVMPLPKDTKYILHDYWISMIISQTGKIDYIDCPTIKYRQHIDNSVGTKTKSEDLKTIEEIRNLFIDVKIEHFEVFIKNENIFQSEKIKSLNKKALKYYKSLANVKLIKISNINLFFKLYKYENFGYKIKNLIILHFPGLISKIYNKLNAKKKDY